MIVEKEPTIGIHKLAELFSCTQISLIRKNKDRIAELHEVSDKKYYKKFHKSNYFDLSKTLYDWSCCVKNAKPDGKILQEKVLEIARHFGCDDLKGSNGWLNHCKKISTVYQHYLSVYCICRFMSELGPAENIPCPDDDSDEVTKDEYEDDPEKMSQQLK